MEVRVKIPIGGVAFFDSGVGGLTVLNACQKRLAGEKFYYYGDNERAPYGSLPPTQIERYVKEAFDLFEQLQVKCAVVACNTVTALCVDGLRARYSFPIIGAEPAVVSAAKRGGEVFVLTTRATFESQRFHLLCEKVQTKYPLAKLTAYACEGLAGEIETHFCDAFYDFTERLPRGSPDAVVLGCTHYVYIRERIKKFYNCEVFDGNEGIAQRLCGLLRQNSACKEQNFTSETAGSEKNRDGRPLFQKSMGEVGIFDHLLSRNAEIKKLGTKTNKCSYIKTRKSRIIPSIKAKNEIYFLGSGADKNKHFCERMFEF
ncbi:MAG: hypothetical protein E7352_02680 [Clostridiales bacterium]|nr:hypothetical protein [Clostridiales bacterium]